MNEDNWGFLTAEVLVIAVISGLATQSWWVFGGVFLGLPLLLLVPYLGTLIVVIISAVYSVVGYLVVTELFEGPQSAAIVAAIFIFLISVGTHLGGVQHLRDM